MKNIAEDSDTYTYIKPHIKEQDGCKDITDLLERYKNYEMIQERALKAKRTLNNLVYCDERQMTFEIFSTKFQAAINTFADCGQDKYIFEADIIDELWRRIQFPGVVSYIDSMKMAQLRTLVKYKILLHNISTQLPSISG